MNEPTSPASDVDGYSLDEWRRFATASSSRDSRLSSRERAFRETQDRLRVRAARKFPFAPSMVFAETLLQQASSYAIARYKAARFAGVGPVADLCCGLGGDLIALASVGPVVGVDRHPVAALLARANLAALGLAGDIVEADVGDFNLAQVAAWHVDPDRRAVASSDARSARTVRLEAFSPGLRWLEEALARRPDACLKLAPATPVPDELAGLGTREWIGSEGETKQQALWTGRFRDDSAHRVAVLLDGDGAAIARFASDGSGEAYCPIADEPGRFVVEPHSALLAADLAESWAATYELSRVAAGVEYFFTGGDAPPASPFGACFEVEDELPFDRKKLKAYLRERCVGTLEIKVRRARVMPETLRKELRVPGDETRTLLVYAEMSGKHRVIVARRCTA